MANLDFWNRPTWLGDSRDNPRDPGFEPFWMRDEAQEQLRPAKLSQLRTSSYGFIRHTGAGVLVWSEEHRLDPIAKGETAAYWLYHHGAISAPTQDMVEAHLTTVRG